MMRIRDYDLLLTWKLTRLIPDLCVYVILNVMRLLCQLLSGPLPLLLSHFSTQQANASLQLLIYLYAKQLLN